MLLQVLVSDTFHLIVDLSESRALTSIVNCNLRWVLRSRQRDTHWRSNIMALWQREGGRQDWLEPVHWLYCSKYSKIVHIRIWWIKKVPRKKKMQRKQYLNYTVTFHFILVHLVQRLDVIWPSRGNSLWHKFVFNIVLWDFGPYCYDNRTNLQQFINLFVQESCLSFVKPILILQ